MRSSSWTTALAVLIPHVLGLAAVALGIVVLRGRVRLARSGSERARAEAEQRATALARRVELLAPMLDAAPIGFAMIDRDLRFRYANAHYATFSGRPVAEHVGRTGGEVFGPEIGRVVDEVISRVLETGEVEAAVRITVPWPTGERHYLTNRYPVRDSGGWIIGVGAGAIDVTEQTELERSYRRALAELTATVRSSPMAIALFGTDLCVRSRCPPWCCAPDGR
jgi:PAS domain S-box-containing protein